MDFATLQTYLLQKKSSAEDSPFGEDSKVYKVQGKMFALVAWMKTPLTITLKCDPADALALRAQYAAVQPGYYMNKQHWNTITLDGNIPEEEFLTWIDDSYHLVVKGLPKSEREKLRDE